MKSSQIFSPTQHLASLLCLFFLQYFTNFIFSCFNYVDILNISNIFTIFGIGTMLCFVPQLFLEIQLDKIQKSLSQPNLKTCRKLKICNFSVEKSSVENILVDKSSLENPSVEKLMSKNLFQSMIRA